MSKAYWDLCEAHNVIALPYGNDQGVVQRFQSGYSGALTRPIAGPFPSRREAEQHVPVLIVKMALWGPAARLLGK